MERSPRQVRFVAGPRELVPWGKLAEPGVFYWALGAIVVCSTIVSLGVEIPQINDAVGNPPGVYMGLGRKIGFFPVFKTSVPNRAF